MTEFIILMASLMSIVAISIDAMLPALGVIGHDLGVTDINHTQFIVSSIFLGMVFGQLICGPLSDALGRRPVLYAGLALYLVGSLFCYFANSLETLLIGRFIQGIGVSGPYITTVAVVRDKYAGRDMAKIMSLVMMIFILVPAVAPTIGTAILHFSTWRTIFLMYVILAVLLPVWIHLRLPETLRPEDKIKFDVADILRGFKIVFSARATMCYMLCMGIMFGSFIGYLNSSRQIFQEQFHVGEAFAFYFGGLALVLGVASLTNSRIVQKVGMRYVCIRATVTIIFASAVFLALQLSMPIQLWMFVIYAAILFFSFGLMFGNLNSIAMEPMGHIAGIASAVTGATSSAMSTLIGAIIGQFYDNSLLPIVTGFLVFNTISLGLMLYEQKSQRAII